MLDSVAQESIKKLLLEKSLNAGLSVDAAQVNIDQVIERLNESTQTLSNTIINELVSIVMMDDSEQMTALIELALKTGSQLRETLTDEQKLALESLRQG